MFTFPQDPTKEIVQRRVKQHREYWLREAASQDELLFFTDEIDKLRNLLYEPFYFIERTPGMALGSFSVRLKDNLPFLELATWNFDAPAIKEYIHHLAFLGHYKTKYTEYDQGAVSLLYTFPEGSFEINFYDKQDCILEEVTVTKTIKRCASKEEA